MLCIGGPNHMSHMPDGNHGDTITYKVMPVRQHNTARAALCWVHQESLTEADRGVFVTFGYVIVHVDMSECDPYPELDGYANCVENDSTLEEMWDKIKQLRERNQ